MATVVGVIVVLRLNAFLALIGAAILVSLLAPGEAAIKIARVAEAFGRTAGSIGIVIALAALIGKAMMDSGAADRIVRGLLDVLGIKRASTAMMSGGLVLAIPVFFDTVFYLLIPLARSMYTRTGRNYLKYIMAIAAGGAAAHNLIPPTPGPLVVAGTLGVDLGTMLLVGGAVAIPAASIGLLFSGWMDRRMPIPLRTEAGGVPEMERVRPVAEPSLLMSVLPIALPVILISANTIVMSMADGEGATGYAGTLAPYTAVVGHPSFALLIAAAITMWTYHRQLRPSRDQMSSMVETALMSAGVIILITSAGGAFGGMLQAAEVGPAIQALFGGGAQGSALVFLLMAFGITSLLKIAQGSSTVAMITAASMLAAMIGGAGTLPFHPVYVATAISSGAMVGSWMNDSGFWIFAKMGGLTEAEALMTWTPLLALMGVVSMIMTLGLALVLPLV
jgi:gluconate:H+ symporter, GntP family